MKTHVVAIWLSVLANAVYFASGVNIEGRVAWNDVCTGYHALGQSKAILDDGRQSAGVRRDGYFAIPEVGPGSYLLSVVSHDFVFDTLQVDVHEGAGVLPFVHPYIPGTPHNATANVALTYPVVLVPRQRNVYFVERQGFNVMGMLNNPMMLMMAVTGVLVLAMPYIMKNLDPELAKEVNERQAKMLQIQNSMQSGDLRSGLSALLSTENESGSPSTVAPTRKGVVSTAGKGRTGSAKGRRR